MLQFPHLRKVALGANMDPQPKEFYSVQLICSIPSGARITVESLICWKNLDARRKSKLNGELGNLAQTSKLGRS